MNRDGGNGRVRAEALEPVRRRGRDLVALAGLGAALAMLWAMTFSFSAQDWGVYRPAGLESQAPLLAPTIHLPPLTLREARDRIELVVSAGGGGDAYGPR